MEKLKIDLNQIIYDTHTPFSYHKQFVNLFQKNCPIIDIPKYPSPKFDFNFDYNDLKKKMSRAFSKYKRTKKDSDWDTYKRLEKDKKRLAQKLTKEKNSRDLDNCGNDSKKAWNVINNISGNPKLNDSPEIKLCKDNQDIPSDGVPQAFCDHFSKIGTEIANSIPPTPQDSFKEFLPPQHSKSFANFQLPSETDILNIINNLQSKTSKDIDNLSMKVIKTVKNEVVPAFTHFICSIITSNTVPQFLKVAKVIVIHKKGDKKDINNYRPISLLPVLSKILERFLNTQITQHISDHLDKNQFGFTKKIGCIDALTEVLDYVRDNKSKKFLSSAFYLDITKAFDTVNHQILIEKLKNFGFQDNALALLQSYIENRAINVFCNNEFSDQKLVNIGVPQGSVLGPTLFLVYINDLAHTLNKIENCKTVLFADDTTIICREKDQNKLNDLLQTVINTAKSWFDMNRLSLHSGKTRLMHFYNSSFDTVQIDGKPIPLVHKNLSERTYKLLGINVDNNLSFHDHVETLCKKLNQYIYGLRRIRYHVNEKARKNYFYAFIHSNSTYCSSIWATSKRNIDKINKIYKKGLRLISNTHTLHTTPLCKKYDILPFDLTLKQITHVQAFKNIFSGKISLATSSRLREKKIAINPSTSGGNLILSEQTQSWNHLPIELRQIDKISSFKKESKKYLFQTLNKPVKCTHFRCPDHRGTIPPV